MKSIFTLICSVVCINCFAQTPPLSQNIDKLQLTTAPAYAVLGVNPTDIDRPSTPRDLATDAQTAIVSGKLTPNFALEITPCYMVDSNERPNNRYLVAYQYVSDNNWARNFARHLSLSAATSATDSTIYGKLKPGTGVGVGISMVLYNGVLDPRVHALYDTWAQSYAKFQFYNQLQGILATGPAFTGAANSDDAHVPLAADVNAGIANARLGAVNIINGSPTIATYLKQRLIALIDNEIINFTTHNPPGASTYRQIVDYVNANYAATQANEDAAALAISSTHIGFTRTGFVLQLAGAFGGVFQKDSSFSTTKAMIWLTPTYRMPFSSGTSQSYLDFMATARLTVNNHNVDISKYYFDFGAKLQYTFNKFVVSYEGLGRWASTTASGNHWTYQSLINATYTISGNLTVTGTFGTKFDGTTWSYTSPNKIFGAAGLNLALADLIQHK